MNPMSLKKKKAAFPPGVNIRAQRDPRLRGNQDLVRGDGGKRWTNNAEEKEKKTSPYSVFLFVI